MQKLLVLLVILLSLSFDRVVGGADEFAIAFVESHCVDCHNSTEANGMINLEVQDDSLGWHKDPYLLERVISQLSSGAMPPPDVADLNESERRSAISQLKKDLRQTVPSLPTEKVPVSRLNRFQYNYTVRDLFQLSRDVFPLPEKLIDRHSAYREAIAGTRSQGQLPAHIRLMNSDSRQKNGFTGVKPFPKDLRAEHGFDNQANQLTLSPLLLDSFFQLSVSIVESPDFNADTVGAWDAIFSDPGDQANLEQTIRKRLSAFLTLAFRQKVDAATVDRYTEYALSHIQTSRNFTAGMKKVAAAVLSSPLFLYRTSAESGGESCYALASRLSYFLWSSCPDRELIELAERGTLRETETLRKTVDRMLRDPKVIRFLDSFPVQWLQLENVLAATPNPKINRYFSLMPDRSAARHMLMEPLLLFDLIFAENRPIIELLSPEISYRSEFLETWYFTDLKPEEVDQASIRQTNQRQDDQRMHWTQLITEYEKKINEIVEPVVAKILKERLGLPSPRDLRPYAAWEFNDNLIDTVKGLALTAKGDVQFVDGSVVLNKAFLQSQTLKDDFVEKSFEVSFSLSNLDQRGGGVMTMQGPGGLFDSIVLGERKNRHWISGSNGFARTEDFPDSFEESIVEQPIHLVMTYHADGKTQLYRNGVPYGEAYQKGKVTFKKDECFLLLGLRHLPAGGNRYLAVKIDQAKLYDRALTSEEAAHAYQFGGSYVSDEELKKELDTLVMSDLLTLREKLRDAREELASVPSNLSIGELTKNKQRAYDDRIKSLIRKREFHRVSVKDPRYGGIMTNAAMLSMTSGPNRTHPVARGVWVTEVVFNDPPSPPPNDIPPLSEDEGDLELTIREQFAIHRENPSCAGCHNRLDPIGFSFENYDITGRWRTEYSNGRQVDASGNLFGRNIFENVVDLKSNLASDPMIFTNAFTQHLMRFALGRDLTPRDRVQVEQITRQLKGVNYPLQQVIKSVVESSSFLD